MTDYSRETTNYPGGPGRSTAAILRVLARYRVPATFFNIGVNVAVRPGLVRKEVRARYATGIIQSA